MRSAGVAMTVTSTREKKYASSAESVGSVRFGESPKRMVEGDFDGAKGPESVGPAGGDPRLVVEALDGAAGQRPFGPKPVEEERAVGAEHAGDLLHGREPGAQRAGAPPVQEPPGPVGR